MLSRPLSTIQTSTTPSSSYKDSETYLLGSADPTTSRIEGNSPTTRDQFATASACTVPLNAAHCYTISHYRVCSALCDKALVCKSLKIQRRDHGHLLFA